MVLVVPVAVMFGGAIWSALFGWLVGDDADDRAEPAPADRRRRTAGRRAQPGLAARQRVWPKR